MENNSNDRLVELAKFYDTYTQKKANELLPQVQKLIGELTYKNLIELEITLDEVKRNLHVRDSLTAHSS